jgi:membrane protein
MSMFPMILGALSLVGLAIRDPATEQRLQNLIVQSFPPSAHDQLVQALSSVKRSAGWLGLLSLGGLAWSASSIFATMEFALTEIFGTRQRNLIRQRAMGLVMMVVLIVAIGFMAAFNAVAPLVPFAWLFSIVAGALVMIGLLTLLYRFVPNRTFGLREVLPGAVVAGVLIEILALAFPLYGRVAGHFNAYGATFGLFFLLATWFYLLSELILLGAVVNKFRLGEPHRLGLVASPMDRSRQKKRTADSIEDRRTDRPPGAAA